MEVIPTSKTLSDVRIILRNDTATNWTSSNPVLLKGEIGVESDTGLFKFGDGSSTWSQLSYSGVIISQSSTNGYINVNGSDILVYTLPNATTSTLGGVKIGTGLSVSSGTVSLGNSGVTAGTYAKVTVDQYGRVTGSSTLSASDIPSGIDVSKITGLGTAATVDTGTSSGNVPILDTNGKLSTTVIPSLAISDIFTAASASAMNALTGMEKGDICIRSDGAGTYIYDGSSWILMSSPTDAVTSVNTKTGAVTLTTSDISEGTNLYYTAARFNTAFATKASTGLTDTDNIVYYDDSVIIDCGNA